MEAGRFREDLYYRLNVVPIFIPPLRQRREDIGVFANLFLEEYSQRLRQRRQELTPESMKLLQQYDWPGNIREIRNVIERAVILCDKPEITPSYLPQEVNGLGRSTDGDGPDFTGEPEPLEAMEKRYIAHVLAYCSRNRSQAASLLEIARSTLINKIKKYEIDEVGGG